MNVIITMESSTIVVSDLWLKLAAVFAGSMLAAVLFCLWHIHLLEQAYRDDVSQQLTPADIVGQMERLAKGKAIKQCLERS